jgi:hypothetical protein
VQKNGMPNLCTKNGMRVFDEVINAWQVEDGTMNDRPISREVINA